MELSPILIHPGTISIPSYETANTEEVPFPDGGTFNYYQIRRRILKYQQQRNSLLSAAIGFFNSFILPTWNCCNGDLFSKPCKILKEVHPGKVQVGRHTYDYWAYQLRDDRSPTGGQPSGQKWDCCTRGCNVGPCTEVTHYHPGMY